MKSLKPLTKAQIYNGIRATKYPKKQFSSELANTLIQMTVEQIKDGRAPQEIKDQLVPTIANRLPKGIEAVDVALDIATRFLKANS